MKKKVVLMLVVLAMCLTGCGKNDEVQEGPTTLTLAVFEESELVKEQVKLFNDTHEDYQIEVKRYSRASDVLEDGRAKLQREIVSGNGPDIIDFGTEFKFSDITGGYTEDLLPYLEGEDYFENIVEAFCYQDKLYALPTFFRLNTYVGSESLLGNRDSWSISEMLDCYEENKGKREFYYCETRGGILGGILDSSMDYYIDWETGTCNFNGEEFKRLLEFAGEFPEFPEIDEEVTQSQLYKDGKVLLYPVYMCDIYDICRSEYLFEDASYIGYPVEGESGSVISLAGPMLSICSSSKHKDAAWEYISQYLEKECQKKGFFGLPVNESALKELLAENAEVEYEITEAGTREKVVKGEIRFYEEEIVPIYNIPKEQADKLLELIENACICGTVDYPLQYALLEEADSYFSGDKSLDEVADIMQSRASIYVSERMGPVSVAAESEKDTKADKEEKEPSSEVTQKDNNIGALSVNRPDVTYEKSLVECSKEYEGEPFRKSVFAAGGDMLYVCGTKESGDYFVGGMKQEGTCFEEFSLEISDNHKILRMAVDKWGYCHALWGTEEKITIGGQELSSFSLENSYITIFNPQGVVEGTIDLSGSLGKEGITTECFAVDNKGNYYVENRSEVLKIASDGSYLEQIVCEGIVEGIGIGKSGNVYVAYATEGPAAFLGKVDGRQVVMQTELPYEGAVYRDIAPAMDGEVVLYNKAGGVYGFEEGSREVKQFISGKDLPVEGMEISGKGFLGDGRLCILEGDADKKVFHYVPVEMGIKE